MKCVCPLFQSQPITGKYGRGKWLVYPRDFSGFLGVLATWSKPFHICLLWQPKIHRSSTWTNGKTWGWVGESYLFHSVTGKRTKHVLREMLGI